jgi:hypothetical protein
MHMYACRASKTGTEQPNLAAFIICYVGWVQQPDDTLVCRFLGACLISWPCKVWPGSQSLASHSPASDSQAACLICVA